MDRRRAAGALLALAACFACTAAAPTASNQTALDLYEGAPEGCYYNFQHYGEGDRIMTNEPCLNCTCHNRMLMCYLRVCPFTKAIGQDCTVEKRADQCCPIVTCPDVPVDLLTSTSTTSPAEYGQTGLGKLDKYGCSISGKYFPEGSKVPPTPNKPCEHCYCIRNMTTCVMQECTLHVDGCTPIYHKDVCCPVRYSCDHPEDEVPLLDDMSTTVRPTPGFLLTTTTVAPVTQMTQDCVHDDQVFADGALIRTEKACEHCYCMKGDIVCVVQECGAPMENEGKNCTSLPPREGQCCPDTYICEGDEISSDQPTEFTTESIIDKLTTLSPPRRAGVEGSGYRNEPDEVYTEMPTLESEVEGSGEELEISKPLESDKDIPVPEDGDQYLSVTTKAPTSEDHEVTEISKNDIPDEYVKEKTTMAPVYEIEKLSTSGITAEEHLVPDKDTQATSEQYYEGITTESVELLNTVPDVITEKEIIKPYEPVSSTTNVPTFEEGESQTTIDSENIDVTHSEIDHDIATSEQEKTSKPEYSTSSYSSSGETTTEIRTEQDSKYDVETTRTTSIASEESTSQAPQTYDEEEEHTKPETYVPSTTTHPELGSDIEGEKSTTEPDHAQNTVAITDEESTHPYLHMQATTIKPPTVEDEATTVSNEEIVTAKDNILSPHEYTSTLSPASEVSELTTTEPDKGLNTIPSDVSKESSTTSTLLEKTTVFEEIKATDSSLATDEKKTANVDIKPTIATVTVTALPESTTKGDQYTITTEPSFRKEDESSVPADKQKEYEMTTVKSEFVDEGLIPTSEHDEKYGASSDIPSAEEETATLIPEYTKKVEETIGSKQTTEISPTEILPSETSKPSTDKDEVFISTEKTVDATTVVPEDIYTHEEPSRIPGEGDCLLNGVTYRNNTNVPSSNNCHTGCRCASSIIKCDPIICSPPPEYMDNCQSIYDSPDSCCPTYVCDHPRETVPPQSDNQMSGTESPMAKPTIECRGDQCEISEPAKQTTQSSEPCTSSHCLPEADQKPAIDCGSQDCGEIAQKPDPALPSLQEPDCTEGKCKPESCASGECQVSPVTPCEGEKCKEFSEVSPPSPQSCEHGEDCKIEKLPDTETAPCEGESCQKIDCGAGNCDPHVISPPNIEQVPCKEGSDCKPEYIPVHDCKGDEPCRRKETSPTEEKPPSKCEGADCEQQEGTAVTQDGTYSTQAHISSVTPVVPEKTTGLPESDVTTLDSKETEEKDTYTTESSIDIRKPEEPILEVAATKTPYLIDEEDKTIPSLEEKPTEKPVVGEKLDEVKPTIQEESTEKSESIGDDLTSKPALMDENKEKKPDTFEKETESTVITDQDRTEKPITSSVESTEKLVTEKTESTETPVLTDEGKEKPVVIKEEETEKPVAVDEEDKEKPSATDDDGTEKPDIAQEVYTVKPLVTGEEEETQKPILDDKDIKEKPTVIEEDTTDKFAVTDEDDREKPAVVEEITPKPNLIDEQDKEYPTAITEKSTDKPISDEGTDKPIMIDEDDKEKPIISDTELPTTEEYGTKKPVIIDEEENANVIKQDDSEKPVDIEVSVRPATIDEATITPTSIADEEKPTTAQEGLEKPFDEEIKDKPAIIDKYDAQKPGFDQETDTEMPEVIKEEHKDKPTVSDEEETETPTHVKDEKEKPDEEKGTEKPVLDEDGKEKPATDEENTEKSTVTDKVPETTDKGYTEQTSVVEDKDKEKPTAVGVKPTQSSGVADETGTEPTYIKEKEKPTIVTEDSEKKPTNEEDTEKPVIEKEGTETPEIINLDTVKPETMDEADKEKPADEDDISSVKPDISKHTVEPSMIDEEDKKQTVSEEDITKKPSMVGEDDKEKSSSEKPIHEEDNVEPSIDEKETTEEPSIGDEKLAVEDGTTKKPSGFDEGTEKPVEVEDESTKTPTIIDEELTEKPTITDQEGTKKPETDEEEGSGTEIPEENIPVTGEESTKADIPVQPTEPTETKKPIYESVTSPAEHEHSTETNLIDIDKDTSPTETPEIKVTESQDSATKVPVILDHTRTSEVATEETVKLESEEEKEKTTPSPVTKMDIYDNKEESSTVGQNMGTDEAELSSKEPEVLRIPESGDIVTKAPQSKPISEQEILTDTTQLDLLTTQTPDVGKKEEETTTKLYGEEDKPKPAPESHVTESSKDKTSTPGYESTSVLPEPSVTSDLFPEHVDKDIHKTESPELIATKPEKGDTQLPGEEEIKSDVAEVPDKNEVITETPTYSVTEPVTSLTEIEDSHVTGQEDVFTGYPEKSTEFILDEVTEKSDKLMPTDIKSPESPEKSPGVEYQEQSTQTPEPEKEKPTFESHATKVPIAVVTESHDTPHVLEKEVTGTEEMTTRIPDISEQTTKDTTESNDYTEKPVTSTKAPESHITEKHIGEDQETSTKSEQPENVTTDLPKSPMKEQEIGTLAPEIMHTDSHDQDMKASTDTSTAVEDVRTEIPDLQVTSEVPQSLVTERQEDLSVRTTISDIKTEESLGTTQFQESTKVPELHIHEHGAPTETPVHITESVERDTEPEISVQEPKTSKLPEEATTEKLQPQAEVTEKSETYPQESEDTTVKQKEEDTKSSEQTTAKVEFSETTPYWIELDEHTHKMVEDIITDSPADKEYTVNAVEDTSVTLPSEEEQTHKIVEDSSTISPEQESSTVHLQTEKEPQIPELTTRKIKDEEIETSTKEAESATKFSEESSPEVVSEKVSESSIEVQDTTPTEGLQIDHKYTTDHKEHVIDTSTQPPEQFTSAVITDAEKTPIYEPESEIPSTPETSSTEKPAHSAVSHETIIPEDEFILSTTKATTLRQDEEIVTPIPDDKFAKPEEKPSETTEVSPVSTTSEISKPSVADMQPTDEIPAPEEEHFGPTGTSGYGEPDYVEEDQAFGPGTCRYGGKVYVSAQQIPRDDPCDFCFCFRSDIICLQQSCPPPIHGCHEEPIQGFCCPRYECPVSMATTVNVTTTTTTTTTTLPPHFPTHSYKGAAQRRGCQIKGHTYKVGEVVRSSSGPCLHCTCGGDGQMKCDPKACTPEPMLRQMIAAAVSAKRRR